MVGDGKAPGEGSGLLQVCPSGFRPNYESSKRRVTFPNGGICTLYSSEEPEQLRGPQHEAAWVDELAKMTNAQEVWDMLQFGLRLGPKPRTLITTTPRPTRSSGHCAVIPRACHPRENSRQRRKPEPRLRGGNHGKICRHPARSSGA